MSELIVIKKDEKVVCEISNSEAPDDMKDYPSDYIVVRESVQTKNVMNIAKDLLNYVQDNAGMLDDYDPQFAFAFPLYGARIIHLKFSTVNLDEETANEIIYGIAVCLCDLLKKYGESRFHREEALKKYIDIVKKMKSIVVVDYETVNRRKFDLERMNK